MPVNLPASFLLGLVLLYWLMVILGVLGMDAFDLDLDADLDFDVEADVDGHFEGSVFGKVLDFFHLGDVPIMIVASFFVLNMWIITIVSNHYFNPEFSWLVLGMWIVPNLVVSLMITKVILLPLATIFKNSDSQQKLRTEMIGQVGVVKTSEVNERFGQIEIQQDGPPIVLNVTASAGRTLGQGDAARIVAYDANQDRYIVELSKWEKSK